MSAIIRYVLLSFRLFVRQWSALGVFIRAQLLLMTLVAANMVIPRWEHAVVLVAPAYGYSFGRSLRGRCSTPDRTVGLIGVPLPLTPRARWVGGLIASGVLGLVLFGVLQAIGLSLFGTWSLEGFARPLCMAMLAYLPWAGAAFLGREGLGLPVLAVVCTVGLLGAAALRWVSPDVWTLSVWCAILLAGAFLAAPRLERMGLSEEQGIVDRRPVPALGAPSLPPFRAWGRVMMQPLAYPWLLFAFFSMPMIYVAVAYLGWRDPGESVQSEVLDSAESLMLVCGLVLGLPLAVGRPLSPLAPAALLPLSAPSLWWGTLLGSVPGSMLAIGALMGWALGAALLMGEPVDPTPYQALLSKAPLGVALVLFVRASWQLGFLLSTIPHGLSIVCAFVLFAASTANPSLVVSSLTLAVSICILAAVAPRRYRAPA